MDSYVLPNKLKRSQQYLISLLLVCLVSGVGFLTTDLLGYRVVALLLLLTLSILAMVFDILPVLSAAVLSAVIWDFFFIPPRFTLTIGSGEDVLFLLMYFVIALVNAVLTSKLRKMEKQALEKQEKEKAIKLYNTILNSLSHELRTPIATIIGATDILKEKNPNISTENKDVLISEISEASLRLNQQVENLLNMSRLESGIITTKLNWIDVNEMIYRVVEKCKEQSADHEIIVQADENLPLVILDGGLMEQAIYNLLNNAILYTPKGSSIHIQTGMFNERLKITIADNGKGFPESEIEKVFDKFYRLYNTQPGGTGLGLSIVKGVVEAHHGAIHLKNGKHSGAVFTIVIPAKTSYLADLKNE
jgi:two-component system sensor histidine kinase KdpD